MPCARYGNRASAMAAFAARLPDLAIIDISLEDEPEGGFELCRQLRALSAELPIIFLTARDSELDAVSGLRLGADDFLTKDLSLAHLSARVNALFRRVDALRRPHEDNQIVRRGPLTLDAERMQVAVGRQGRAAFAHRVLDRARAREAPRPREEPAAAHGRRERRARRQHHHLAHQAHPAEIPGVRPEVRRRADRLRHGLSLGRVTTRHRGRLRLLQLGPSVSLRLKLLLLSLLDPRAAVGGCQYAREMESVLREGEKQSLARGGADHRRLAAGRGDLLYRARPRPSSPKLETATTCSRCRCPASPSSTAMRDEWPTTRRARWKSSTTTTTASASSPACTSACSIALLDVRDDKLVFDAPTRRRSMPDALGDRVWLGFEDADGAERQVCSLGAPARAPCAPGASRRANTGAGGRRRAAHRRRVWQPTARTATAWSCDAAFDARQRFGVLVDDRDERGALPASYGTLRGDDLHTRGRLIAASPELSDLSDSSSSPACALTVSRPPPHALDARLCLATTRGCAASCRAVRETAAHPRAALSAALLDARRATHRHPEARVRRSTNREIVTSASSAPCRVIQLAQTVDRWLTLRDRALTTLLNFTLITTLVRRARDVRVRRAPGAAARAAAAGERIRAHARRPASRHSPRPSARTSSAICRAELLDAARRLNEYTGYLRTLAGKLAHEIRTPLTIVRSSLENLESEGRLTAWSREGLPRRAPARAATG